MKISRFSSFVFLISTLLFFPLYGQEKNKTEEILKLAVKRMLPGGPLAKKQLTKLKIYNGNSHPHEIQKPKIIEFDKLNKKNTVK